MEVYFLGTAGTIPTKNRGLISTAIKRKGEILLFDCGEGTQRKLITMKLSMIKISNIFISHLHGDHVTGLAGLILSNSLLQRLEPLNIYGPPGIDKLIQSIPETIVFNLDYIINVHEISEKGEILLEREEYVVKAFPVDHGIQAFGFSLEERPRPGKFFPDKAFEMGVTDKRFWSELQAGRSIYVSGKVIQPDDVMGPPRMGRKIVYSGDTRPCKSIIESCKLADLLIHEGTFSGNLEKEANERGHSTVIQAAQIAKDAGTKLLAIVHISARYPSIEPLEKEIKSIFENTIFPDDETSIKIEYSE